MRFVKAVRIASLKPMPKNPRAHTDLDLDALVRSIGKFGWTNPVLVQEKTNRILAGHGRVEAATRLGLKTVPAVFLRLTKTEADAYTIADNQLATLSSWDEGKLSAMLKELEEEKFDLSLLGFSEKELQNFLDADLTNEEDGDLDKAPPLPSKPCTKAGDLWILGGSRLLCSDCTDPGAVACVMDGKKAGLMNTDPPYGVDYAGVKNGMPGTGFQDIVARGGAIENDDLTNGPALQAFLEKSIRAAVPHLIDNPAFYLWHPMLTQGTFFAAADILIHRQIIWVKPHMVLTRSGMYHWKHELCFYGWIRGKKPKWYGDFSQVSVWEVGHPDHDRQHPTQKPVELFARPILNHTKQGEILYEPFAGSGSQFIAAEKLNRICYGLEIEPKYCDVVIDRWQNLTGKKAHRLKAVTASHE